MLKSMVAPFGSFQQNERICLKEISISTIHVGIKEQARIICDAQIFTHNYVSFSK
jgi:hypothetical protein